jgi:hypothetical protein
MLAPDHQKKKKTYWVDNPDHMVDNTGMGSRAVVEDRAGVSNRDFICWKLFLSITVAVSSRGTYTILCGSNGLEATEESRPAGFNIFIRDAWVSKICPNYGMAGRKELPF